MCFNVVMFLKVYHCISLIAATRAEGGLVVFVCVVVLIVVVVFVVVLVVVVIVGPKLNLKFR